jgi:type I restriction enzyme S subunit
MKLVPLTSICKPKQWKTISTKELKEDGFPVYGANGKIGYYGSYTHEHPTVLITCRGATCGTINISEPKSYVNGNAMALDNLSEDVNLYYLAHYLRFRKLDDVISGSAQPQITGQGLSNLQIPLPPLPQQKKIAAILDAADAYRQKTKALIAKYDELTQSLFLDMFGDPRKNKAHFPKLTMDEIADKITDGDHATPKRESSGYKLLSCRNIKNGYIDFNSGLDYVGEDEFNRMRKRCNPEYGDILISCSGTIGRTTSIKTNEEFVLVRSAALVKIQKDKVSSTYIEYYLRTEFMQSTMQSSSKSSGQANLFTGPIKKLPVIIPPLNLQTQFAERVQAIEIQKAQAQASLEKAEELFNSLLQRAFNGELA